jgi:hypothetical protein
LYEDGVVKIEDHPRDGFGSSSDNQKKYLAQRIFSRLSIEDSAFKLNNTRWIDYYNKGYFSLTPFPKGEYDVNEWINSNILNNG